MEEQIKLEEYFTAKTLQIIEAAKPNESDSKKWNQEVIMQDVHSIFQNNNIPLPIAIASLSELLATYLLASAEYKRISFQNSSKIN